LTKELAEADAADVMPLGHDDSLGLFSRLAEFAHEPGAALVLKISSLPSRVATTIVPRLLEWSPDCSLQSHAGNGVTIVRFPAFSSAEITTQIIGRIRPLAVEGSGTASVLSSDFPNEWTRAAAWGTPGSAMDVMSAVKAKFDPRGILNPGRNLV
jgi:FAD/FMN-containing dehydrogenase